MKIGDMVQIVEYNDLFNLHKVDHEGKLILKGSFVPSMRDCTGKIGIIVGLGDDFYRVRTSHGAFWWDYIDLIKLEVLNSEEDKNTMLELQG